MLKLAKRFLGDDSGAVTVDWVILTAAVVGLATIAYIGINDQTNLLAQNTADAIPTQVGD
ncbi:hypothetical protein SAMN05216196_101667 [Lutimaribacter pacificus]|uniref:Flp pilus assembly protein, pilin Flp n=1 Tax=Lutimaribacter pacificus TaxID=391948 RepID=A0A1H0BRQ5_9RHOB|nr:hypothetical protein [Lutimaribacter pacificus]SDN48243.1 hypothetical protein SAMN05216196_101667 [Lutimaribacter pacificus]SHJ52983.1 hypothetical protein SAMN05444142_101550 [Lutimaribacter pacificus]